jgi:hypothetical protein
MIFRIERAHASPTASYNLPLARAGHGVRNRCAPANTCSAAPAGRHADLAQASDSADAPADPAGDGNIGAHLDRGRYPGGGPSHGDADAQRARHARVRV